MSIIDVTTQVVSRIQGDLTGQAESLLGELESTRGELEGMMSELDGEWETLSSRAEAVITRATEVEAKIKEIGSALVSRAEETRTAVDGAIEQGNARFDAARGVVENVTSAIGALVPDADDIAGVVDTTVKTLQDEMQSLDEALEATRSITDEHLRNPFDALVTEVETQLQSRLDEWSTYVDSDFLVNTADQVSQLKSHVDEVVSEATDKLSEVQSTAETEGQSAMQHVQDMFGKEFGQLIETAQTLANVIQQVGNAISGVGQAVGTTTQVMTAGVSTTAIGAKAAIGIIEDIVEIFESVT